MLLWRDPVPQNLDPLNELGLPPLISGILLRRGLTTPTAARAFLDPLLAPPASPFDLPGLQTAVSLLEQAIAQHQRILVWGDFDVDGQTATAILLESLTALRADVSFYIPSRERESHGIRPASLASVLEERRPQVLLTCDTGIAAHEGLELAAQRGLTVIVTDHHELPPSLPRADCLVNPRFLPAEHSQASLTGAGVAFKLAEALLSPALAETLLDLTALGLIADVAALTGETRRLTQRGLQTLRQTTRPGLLALMELSGSQQAQMNETGVGFALAPRLNALGRLAQADPAVELLTTRDPARARVLAEHLESLNQQRRFLTRQVIQAAEALLRENPQELAAPAIVLHNPAWPAGIVGIAANALAERYRKPAILFCGENPLRGSARSTPGVHITQAIAACGLPANTFGGHPMAAGLSLPAADWNAFRRHFFRAVQESQSAAPAPLGELALEAWLPLQDLTLELAASLEALAPFGAGNPAPIFAARNLRLIQDINHFGKTGEHRKLRVANESALERELLWWGGAEEEAPPELFDAAFSLRASTWRGSLQLSLELQDWRPAQAAAPLEISSPLEWIDERAAPDPLARLQFWQAAEPQAALWAEGEHKNLPQAQPRWQLPRAETLLLWTPPPNQRALRQVLERVQPRRVIVFACPLAAPQPGSFARQTASLLKFALEHRAGKTSLTELAAALAAGEEETLAALKWLQSQGKLRFSRDESDQIFLQAAALAPQEPANGPAFLHLQQTLQETAAYRAVFARRRLE